MEDAATAEISRAQLWQWIKNSATLDNGEIITNELFLKLVNEELEVIKNEIGDDNFDNGKFKLATKLFVEMIQKDDFDEFLTLPAYQHI